MEDSQFGRTYSEFEEGQVFRHWPGKTVTDFDNHLFSLITMNHHPVHIDQHYASQAHHGKILVVGTLIFSLVVGLSVRDISGKAVANLGYEEVKHLAPTFLGDTIYARSKVLSKEESLSKPEWGKVKVETKAFNQREEEVLSFKRTILVPKV